MMHRNLTRNLSGNLGGMGRRPNRDMRPIARTNGRAVGDGERVFKRSSGPMSWAALRFAKHPRADLRLFKDLYPSLLFSTLYYFTLPLTAQRSVLPSAHDESADLPREPARSHLCPGAVGP